MLDFLLNGRLFEAFLEIGRKGFGRQRLTVEACRDVEILWKRRSDSFSTVQSLSALYDRLIHEGVRGVFTDEEMRRVVNFIFYGCGPKRQPLYRDPVIVDFAADFVAKNDPDGSLSTAWCRGLYQIWPGTDAELKPLIEHTRPLAKKDERLGNLLRSGWIDAAAAVHAAERPVNLKSPRDYVAVDDYIFRVSRGLIASNSAFTTAAWSRGFRHYTTMVLEADDDGKRLREWLGRIEKESVFAARRFRNLDYADDFVRAIVFPYRQGGGRVPTKSVEEALWQFFSRLFGEMTDPAAAHVWVQIDKELRELIDYWRQGRALIGAFDMIGAIVACYATSDSTGARHWTERRDFWRDKYWNSGYVRTSRVYVPSRHIHCQEVYTYSARGVAVSDAGSAPAGKCELFMILSSGTDGKSVLVVEQNFNGALFIVDLEKHPEMKNYLKQTRLPSYWLDDLRQKGERVEHRGNWESQTKAIINRMLDARIW